MPVEPKIMWAGLYNWTSRETYLKNTLVEVSHAIIRFQALLTEIYCSRGPMGVVVIDRDQDYILCKDINLLDLGYDLLKRRGEKLFTFLVHFANLPFS